MCLGSVRLNGSPTSKHTQGRLEVYQDGEWLQVCRNNWDLSLSHRVCEQLGFSSAINTQDRDEAATLGQGNRVVAEVCNEIIHFNPVSSDNFDLGVEQRKN